MCAYSQSTSQMVRVMMSEVELAEGNILDLLSFELSF